MKRQTIIAYSLDYDTTIKCFLPSAYFVEAGEDNRLAYMIAKAVPQNWESYQEAITDTRHESLMGLCHELIPKTLEEKYAARKKKASLKQLCEDPAIHGVILQYIQRRMKAFLSQIRECGYPLCLGIERNVYLEDIRLTWTNQSLQPNLAFKKQTKGIEYTLTLNVQDKKIVPHHHDIQVILDKPGLIILDYQIFRLESINGNKLKPFAGKETLFIPQRITRTYFEKFILDVVNKVDIEATGFEVEVINEIKGVAINFNEDFLEDRFVLDLEIDYGETSFNGSDLNQRRNRMILDDSGGVVIKQIVRSVKESDFVQVLLDLGLEKNAARRFYQPGARKYDLIQWVIDHKPILLSHQFKINAPLINGLPVQLSNAEIKLSVLDDNDWFDISGVIQIGDIEFYFVDLLDAIRNENPIYKLANGKIFIIPASWMTKYRALADFGTKQGQQLKIKKSQYTVVEETGEFTERIRQAVTQDEDVTYLPDPQLKATLRPYQIEGVKWLIKHQQNGLGACLADDMGLGKTLQTLAVLNYTKTRIPVPETSIVNDSQQLDLFARPSQETRASLRALVLLPASLVFNWLEEIEKFCPHFLVCSFIGNDRHQVKHRLDQFDMVLTTYQTALRDIKILERHQWEYIILDESHMIKNRESKIFQAVNQLSTSYKISLSGTPIENSLADLWSQMQFINPDILGTFSFFKKHFLIPIQKQQDEKSLQQLRSIVEPFILRRRKQEVAQDLPEISSQIEYVPMTNEQKKMFDEEKSAARNHLLALSEEAPDFTFHVLRSLLRLRQIANHPKLLDAGLELTSGKFNHMVGQLHSVLQSGYKVLVFSSFTTHLQLLADCLSQDEIPYCKLTGKSTQKQRQEEVYKFQNDPKYQVFLISIKAGGTGLNLTSADYVFILDPWWNPFVEEQAIARAHRIGRALPISVIRFISKDSIEEKIIRLQARKKILSAELIENTEEVSLAKEDLRYLLE